MIRSDCLIQNTRVHDQHVSYIFFWNTFPYTLSQVVSSVISIGARKYFRAIRQIAYAALFRIIPVMKVLLRLSVRIHILETENNPALFTVLSGWHIQGQIWKFNQFRGGDLSIHPLEQHSSVNIRHMI